MIKIKIDKNKLNEPVFKLWFKELNEKEERFLKRLSKLSFLNFSHYFDEKYFYIFQVNARYMKKLREERCPNIFKIEIDKETLEIKKEVIFKKIDPVYV